MTCQFFNQWEAKRKTAESIYVIAIATVSDWAKNLSPDFQPMRSKTKTHRFFSRALSKVHVTARNSDWFTALCAPLVIGRNNYFTNGMPSNHKRVNIEISIHGHFVSC